MAGGMGVRKNVHIEQWASYRENCEHVFRFSKANWARFAVFGIAVPVGLYVWIGSEMLPNGHASGRGPERLGYERKYLGFAPKDQ